MPPFVASRRGLCCNTSSNSFEQNLSRVLLTIWQIKASGWKAMPLKLRPQALFAFQVGRWQTLPTLANIAIDKECHCQRLPLDLKTNKARFTYPWSCRQGKEGWWSWWSRSWYPLMIPKVTQLLLTYPWSCSCGQAKYGEYVKILPRLHFHLKTLLINTNLGNLFV